VGFGLGPDFTVMKGEKMNKLMTIAVLLCAGLNAGATVYYVSPFESIQAAAWKTKPGDIVVVNPGVYHGGFVIPFSGTANAHITYMAYPGTSPVILLSTSDWWGIAVPPGISYVDIVGFTVVGSAQQVTQAQAAAWASQNLLYPANGQSCIAIGGNLAQGAAHHITVYKNNVSFCPGAGIYSAHADYINVMNNRAHDNGWWNWNGPSGISLYGMVNTDTYTGTKNYVVNNVSYSNIQKVPNSVLGITDGNGIVIDKNENTDDTHIPYNARTYVANNVVYMNGGNGIITFHSRHVDIVNNSTYANNRSPINRGEIQANLSSDINVLNNILYAAPDKAVVVDGQSTNVNWDYNLIYGGNATPILWGSHDLWAYPYYLAPSLGLLQLITPFSPAVGTGTFYLAPGTDIQGVARQGHVDRGAYQSY
jgi:hypothetical protein